MTLETLLGFRSIDSTENINARLAGLIPKGIVLGGNVIPEPASLQVRIARTAGNPWVFTAFAADGMVVRERSEEHVLPVVAGIDNVIVLRAKYVDSGDPVSVLEVMSLGAYLDDPEQSILIRFASVSPPAGATSVLPENINTGFRDAIEGFTRRIVREVVNTKEDLPAVSGFPATAEVNFLGNNFATGTTLTFAATSVTTLFNFIPAYSFRLADPSAVPNGLSRSNASQKSITSITQNITPGPSLGIVTVTTSSAHGFSSSQWVRISETRDARVNQKWLISSVPTVNQFQFSATVGVTPISAISGNVVDDVTFALVTARTAEGVRHSLVANDHFTISGAIDPTFDGSFSVLDVVDEQTFHYHQTSYPSRDSGGGRAIKSSILVPQNAVEIGESDDVTAKNLETTFRASLLAPDIRARAIGSSLQFEAVTAGVVGNSYTLSKSEPGLAPAAQQIVLSGTNFIGGVDAISGGTGVNLQDGDIYVVLYGEMGTLELWGYDGTVFRNLTSASTATLLDFHRRNQFVNEKHLSENEKTALQGTVGIPSSTNRYVTEQDTSVLTTAIAQALAGADGVAPSGSNRYLTEARTRGQRGNVMVGTGRNWVQFPYSEPKGRWVVGPNNSAETTYNNVLRNFNVVFTDSLNNAGGPSEYTQQDFTPLTVVGVYVDVSNNPLPNHHPDFTPTNELTTTAPSGSGYNLWVDTNGIFPRLEAAALNYPQFMWALLSGVPNNGDCSVLYVDAITEKSRKPQADAEATPQRIESAAVSSITNKVQELRFNSGISVSGTEVSFPADLFSASNVQNYTLRRELAGRFVTLTNGFSFDFSSGIGSGVESWSSLDWAAVLPTPNAWTRFVFALSQDPTEQVVRVLHISGVTEKSSDSLYNLDPTAVALPSLPFQNGEWIFASVLVQSSVGTVSNILSSSVELYPYQKSNLPASPILVGDGVNSSGHFTGTDALVRALQWAPSGSYVKVLSGTYSGNAIVVYDQSNITIDCTAGGTLTSPTTAITVVGKSFRGLGLRFDNCLVAMDVQGGADNFSVLEPVFGSSVSTKMLTPKRVQLTGVSTVTNQFTYNSHGFAEGSTVTFTTTGTLTMSPAQNIYYVTNPTTNTFQVSSLPDLSDIVDIITASGAQYAGAGALQIGSQTVSGALIDSQMFNRTQSIATFTVTDGTGTLPIVGDFNSPDGVQQAHDSAAPGDLILIYPGTYNEVLVSQSGLSFYGQAGAGVIINAAAGQTCLYVTGSYNQFDNLVLQSLGGGTGIDCSVDLGPTPIGNVFGSGVTFRDGLLNNIKYPVGLTARHYNYHPMTSSPVGIVTVGDGVNSWGDYNGDGGINSAVAAEPSGTKVMVGSGTYVSLNIASKDRMTVEGIPTAGEGGSYQAAIIDSGTDAQCVSIVGNYNRIKSVFLKSTGNESRNLSTYGVYVNGAWNLIEDINWERGTADRIDQSKIMFILSGSYNKFIPHTGGLTGYVSWTVGDGVRSFGDHNNSITSALSALPDAPKGGSCTLTSASAHRALLTLTENAFDPGYSLDPSTYSLYRYVSLTDSSNPENTDSTVGGQGGSFRIVQYVAPNQVWLERVDGLEFVNNTTGSVTWRFLAGTKIWVLPGTYPAFDVETNDVDIEAWGAGSDVIIAGTNSQSPVVQVKGSRNRIKGLRIAGGVPITGVGIQITGDDNVFDANKFETAVRYSIDSVAGGASRDALRNKILDTIEYQGRESVTISNHPSRGDYCVAAGQNATDTIQAAVNAMSTDSHLKRVVLGAGDYVLTSPVYVPPNVVIAGFGRSTHLTTPSASGGFPAFQLDSGGGQTISGMWFDTFSYSLEGLAPVSDVLFIGCWTSAAPVNPNVSLIPLGGGVYTLPVQVGHAGEFLSTNGAADSWKAPLPTQASNAGSFLTTDGSSAAWLAIPTATSAVTGLLTNTDWSTFNDKEAAQTKGNVSTSTSGITITGGSSSTVGPNITVDIVTASSSTDGLLSAADWSTFNGKEAAQSKGNISTSTSGVTITGGSSSTVGPNVTVDITTATSSSIGLLTAADWQTFKGAANGAITWPAITVLSSATSFGVTSPIITLTASTKVSMPSYTEFTHIGTRTALSSTIPLLTATSLSFDCSAASFWRKTGSATPQTITLTSMAEGQTITVAIETVAAQAAITWGGYTYRWSNAVVPVPTASSGRLDRYMFQKINGIVSGSASMNEY